MAKKTGRPSVYTVKLASEICDAIASSSAGLKTLCESNKSWPCPDTIYTWLRIYPEFSEMYAQAKRIQVEVLVDELLGIADDTSQDTSQGESDNPITNHEHIARSRLRIDTRKWLASKLAPRIYGERLKFDSDLNIKHEQAINELK